MKQSIILCSLFLFLFLHPKSTLAYNEPYDTLLVKLGGSNQVRVVSTSFDDLLKYSRADSLIAVFFTDIKKSFQDKEYSEWPQVLHYLVNGDGRRRLKIQSNEFTEEEFNLQNEKYRFAENLPLFHYIIYDISKSVEIHLYLESADKIKLFEQFSLDSAIDILKQNKKVCNRTYAIEVLGENGSYKLGKTKGNKMYSVIYSLDLNALLIGSRWTPTFGGKGALIIKDKYANPFMSIGVAILYYGFYELNNGTFKIESNAGYDFRWAINTSKKQGNPVWFGLEGGIIKGMQSNTMGFRGTAYRLSMLTEINGLGFVFGSIRDASKSGASYLGIRLPF